MHSMTHNDIAIDVKGLTKRYADLLAVDNISFAVDRGELFGFLGPNGAGKTTTINLLTGLARADSGVVNIDGVDIGKHLKMAQRHIGVVPDESNLYPELSGFENLCFCASLYGIPYKERQKRAVDLLDVFGLADAARRRFATYSRGMKRKLTIAAGIIHSPPILFLDEPTTGLDVASARQLRKLIADIQSEGTTIFLTTHYIEEAERLCRRIAFIVAGRIVRTDTVANLLKPVEGKNVLIISVSDCNDDMLQSLKSAFPDCRFEIKSSGQIRVESAEPPSTGRLAQLLEERGIDVREARRYSPSLEDVFVEVTGIEAEKILKEKEKAGAGR